MKILVFLIFALSPISAISKPAKDSSKYSRSLVWTPDRTQKAPVWRLSDTNFSNNFKYLETKNVLTTKAKPSQEEPESVEEETLNNSDENASEINE